LHKTSGSPHEDEHHVIRRLVSYQSSPQFPHSTRWCAENGLAKPCLQEWRNPRKAELRQSEDITVFQGLGSGQNKPVMFGSFTREQGIKGTLN
jgi:hypothetical protein